jgi:hypothetical protein
MEKFFVGRKYTLAIAGFAMKSLLKLKMISLQTKLIRDKKMKTRMLILVMFFTFGLTACKDKKAVEREHIVKEWIGKTIEFPENLQSTVFGKDSVLDVDLFQKDYKILLYVDSTGCSSCRLKLSALKQLITTVDTLFHEQVGCILFFQPKNKKEMNILFKEANFTYPVFIDMKNTIDKLNHFPKQELYQCFLLDKDNKVLRIGNPLLKQKIWEMYKQEIEGNITSLQQNFTSVEVDKAKHDFGNIKMEESNEVVFQLKNTGAYPLTIHNVSTSCGCTTVEWDKQPAKQREIAQIRVNIKPDEEGSFNKTIDVHCNTEKPVKLIISGTVNKQIINTKKKEVVKKQD